MVCLVIRIRDVYHSREEQKRGGKRQQIYVQKVFPSMEAYLPKLRMVLHSPHLKQFLWNTLSSAAERSEKYTALLQKAHISLLVFNMLMVVVCLQVMEEFGNRVRVLVLWWL